MSLNGQGDELDRHPEGLAERRIAEELAVVVEADAPDRVTEAEVEEALPDPVADRVDDDRQDKQQRGRQEQVGQDPFESRPLSSRPPCAVCGGGRHFRLSRPN